MSSFKTFFCSGNSGRDNYLARLFGIFNEEIVRCWCRCPSSPYEDLGRPTVYAVGSRQGHTLDFTLRRRATGETFVAEMKCELSLDGYRYLTLEDPQQIGHHLSKAAFQKLVGAARQPRSFEVWIGGVNGGNRVEIDGAVLIWGATSPKGREAAMKKYGFSDVLSLEEMLNDLLENGSEMWLEKIGQLRGWSVELFSFLSGLK